MAFLAMGVEKSLLKQERNNYQYEEILASEYYNDKKSQVEACGTTTSPDTLNSLKEEESHFQIEMDTCSDMLTEIDAEITSYESSMGANIKSECKLNFS